MFDISDRYALNALHEIQDLVKQNPVYYTIIGEIINQIEKPIMYSVTLRFKDFRIVKHGEICKQYVRDNYLYLKHDCITLCYNMDELVSYEVVEIKQEDRKNENE